MYVNYRDLLRKINPNYRDAQIQVMEYYLGETVDFRRRNYANPFRVDRTGGCRFSFTGNDSLLFIDSSNYDNNLTCFGVVQKRFQLDFHQALVRIAKDFNIIAYDLATDNPDVSNDFPKVDLLITTSSKKRKHSTQDYLKKRCEIKIDARSWNRSDRAYWYNKYRITLNTLKFYNVYPVHRAHLSNGYDKFKTVFSYERNQELSYAYLVGYYSEDEENSRVIEGIKLYKPFDTSKNKWMSNLCSKHVFGYEQLPAKGDILIITKALKDVMALYEIGIWAVAFQSEAVNPDEDIMESLKSRFDRIYFLYDLDLTGIKNSIKYAEMFKVKVRFLEKKESDVYQKDVSDYIENYGQQFMYDYIVSIL